MASQLDLLSILLPHPDIDDRPTANPDPKPKKTKGRRKIPIEKISNKMKKHVTFSKRRKGLFSKARELCVLCGASVAIVTFTEAGKPFSFGHPSADAVIHRFLHGGSGASSSHPPPPIAAVPVQERPFWWDRSVDELGLQDLEAFAASLEKMRGNVERRIADLHELDLASLEVKTEFVDQDCYMNQMNNDGFVSQDFTPMSYQPEINHDQYQYYGGDDDIASIVYSMAGFKYRF